MEQDPNNTEPGRCIPYAWSPLDQYRVRRPQMPTPCPCKSADCRKNYDQIKKQVDEIIKVLSKNK